MEPSANLIKNIAFYKFVSLNNHDFLCDQLQHKAEELSLKGTILLATEGINGMIAGLTPAVEEFEGLLKSNPSFEDLTFKSSYSTTVPFQRLKVKVKTEILTLGLHDIQPGIQSVPYIQPQELARILKNKEDITLIDIRNDFEVSFGTFEGAINPRTKSFTDFVEFSKRLNLDKSKPVVTFCTGGIRCEKGALLLKRAGFQDVRQLEGGILNYMAEVPEAPFFNGRCFVFDERETLDSQLKAKT